MCHREQIILTSYFTVNVNAAACGMDSEGNEYEM
jgi:hypothetical protein